jgi:oligopeptide/dipeptide ABC transporter ATP-binding protein
MLLEVKNLQTHFFSDDGVVKAVDDVSFGLNEGESLGIVGESGCGKSVTSLSIMRLVAHPGKVAGGTILYKGKDLLGMPESEMRKIRGNEISMIFQEPMTSLNPVFTVGYQIAEAIMLHQKKSKAEAMTMAAAMLKLVAIPDPDKRVNDYPHQLSGGMRQRVMIAMALSCNPKLLIADEPTTALDVTIQAQILDILRDLRTRFGLSTILITHNLGVVAEFAERVIVMYTGKVREEAPVLELFKNPLHPYTQGLMNSMPKLGQKGHTRLPTIEGMVPDLLHLPTGCSFYDRCPKRMDHCKTSEPPLLEVAPGHKVACYLYGGGPAQ